jgi:hypothetical protein
MRSPLTPQLFQNLKRNFYFSGIGIKEKPKDAIYLNVLHVVLDQTDRLPLTALLPIQMRL